MDSDQDDWPPIDQPIRRARTLTMVGGALERYFGRRATRGASVQAGESPAPTETTQESKNPTGRQAAPDVPQDIGAHSLGQVMGEQPSTSQDRDSDRETLAIAEDVGEEKPESGDVKEPGVPQETTEGNHLTGIPQESEALDNEKNAGPEAQRKD